MQSQQSPQALRLDRSEGIKFDLAGMFDFKQPQGKKLILNPSTGEPERKH